MAMDTLRVGRTTMDTLETKEAVALDTHGIRKAKTVEWETSKKQHL